MGYKCDCCGEKKTEGHKMIVGKGLNEAELWVCAECYDKIKAVSAGTLNSKNVITGNTAPKLASYINSIGNGSGKGNAVVIDNYDGNNTGLGGYIKGLSILVTVLAVIGSLFIMSQDILGVAILILSVLFGSICYGIGEICCLLKSIDSKMK